MSTVDKGAGGDPEASPSKADEDAQVEEVVAFFRRLSGAARREYDALADRDRRFGEDVAAELRMLEKDTP
jgi:hypothetical protein